MSRKSPIHVLALSGGVGGAKMALGLSKVLAANELTIVANTADDFEHISLSISPDLDTVMYTLAGINNKQQGWGLANESWNAMDALERLKSETWFRLGDRDLATHLERSHRLRQGQCLSVITRDLCQNLGVNHRILPMSDDIVRTMVKTDNGDLAFQEYFVRDQCRPRVEDFYFNGIDKAIPQNQLMELLSGDQLMAIIICPSNPFVSVDPILKLTGVREALKNNPAPIIAVSPIVSGLAIKGPAAKMMAELNMPVTSMAVADYYGDLLDGYVIDIADQKLRESIEKLGVEVCCSKTIMTSLYDRINLAETILTFAKTLQNK